MTGNKEMTIRLSGINFNYIDSIAAAQIVSKSAQCKSYHKDLVLECEFNMEHHQLYNYVMPPFTTLND